MQDVIQMRDANPTFPGSAVLGDGFVVELFDKVDSLLVPAH